MSTGFYLLDHPNPNAKHNYDGDYWGYATRVAPESGCCVIHTAENFLDEIGVDTGAESVANYFTHSDRPASYHDLHDSDSDVPCLPPDHTAFHVARSGINRHAWGQSFALKARQWGDNPQWTDRALRRGSARAAWYVRRMSEKGIIVPLKVISVTDADAMRSGFVAHGQLQADRSDPGWGGVMWNRYFSLIEIELGGPVAKATGAFEEVTVEGPGRIRVRGWSGEPSHRVAIWAQDRYGQDVKLNNRSSFVAAKERADLPDGAAAFNRYLDVPYLDGEIRVRASLETEDGWLAPEYGQSPQTVTIDPLPTGGPDIAAAADRVNTAIEELLEVRDILSGA